MEKIEQLQQSILDGDLAGAESLILDIQASPDAETRYMAAELLGEYGFLQEADLLYDGLLKLMPDEAQLKIDRAQVLMELGEEDEALLLLSSVRPDEEEYTQALLVLADYYQMAGMAESALRKVEEAAAIMPDEPAILFAKAELLLDSGRYSQAARLYGEIRKSAEEIAGVRLTSRIAEAYAAGAAYEEALPYYRESLEHARTPDLLFGYAYAAYQSGLYKEAVEVLGELKEIDPDYFSAYALLAQAQTMTGEDEAAYRTLGEGLTRDKYDKELYLAAGKLALKTGRPGEAEEHLREAIALDPEYMEAIHALLSLYDQNERDAETIAMIGELRKEGTDWSGLYPFAAYAYEREEDYPNAYEFYRLAYHEFKEDPQFLEKFALFLLDEGKREEAIEVIQRLAVLVPDDPRWTSFLENDM
ncbi:tetratricopeptide repeat protein [Bhargavaea cecembensis]|uniref:tetratricopeptide repeat protein n=1 Tax=Bhargavaea cecembensis TaxID=394098 RepID=UPI00058F9277|nr:tetratricopeptide repeat protein [Bhargavaea cecembensis]